MELTPQQMEGLYKLVVSAFTTIDQLRLICYFKLGAELEKEFIGPGLPLETAVFDLLLELKSRGLLLVLVKAVVEARPNLKDALELFLIALGDMPSETQDQVDKVKKGMDEVAGELNNNSVFQLVRGSESVLAKLAKDIALLRSYKALHDTLHFFQKSLRSLATMLREMHANPGSVDALVLLTNLQDRLLPASAAIQDLPDDPPAIRAVEVNWLNRISDACVDLTQAAQTGDIAVGRQAVRKIEQVVQLQPNRINTNLSVTAGALNLKELITLFSNARRLPNVAPSILPNLSHGEEAAEQLLREVRALVNQHTEWQEMDIDLWSAAQALPKSDTDDPSDFDSSWKGVKWRFEKLAGVEPGSGWAKELTDAAAEVDAARGAEVHTLIFTKLLNSFGRFQIKAVSKFYKLDFQLLQFTGAILAIRGALLALLDSLKKS